MGIGVGSTIFIVVSALAVPGWAGAPQVQAMDPLVADTVRGSAIIPMPTPRDRPESTYAEREFRASQRAVVVGNVATGAGLGLCLAGLLTGAPVMATIGSLTFNATLPLVGVQAGDMGTMAEKINPAYHDEGRIWVWYFGAVGLSSLCLIEVLNTRTDGVPTVAVVLGIASTVFTGVAWYAFNARANDAVNGLENRRRAISRIRVYPDLGYRAAAGETGAWRAGLRLAWNP